MDREGDLLTEAQQQWRGEKVKHKMNPEDRVALLGRRGMVIYVQPKFRPLPSRPGRNFRLKYPRDIPGGGVSAYLGRSLRPGHVEQKFRPELPVEFRPLPELCNMSELVVGRRLRPVQDRRLRPSRMSKSSAHKFREGSASCQGAGD